MNRSDSYKVTELVAELRRHAGMMTSDEVEEGVRELLADAAKLMLSAAESLSGPVEQSEDAERYQWFRDQCDYDRQHDIIDAAEGVADMLDHHIDKGRCGL